MHHTKVLIVFAAMLSVNMGVYAHPVDASNYISNVAVVEEDQADYFSTGKHFCLKNLNIRTSPGDEEITGLYKKGDSVNIFKLDGNYALTEKGWVYAPFLSKYPASLPITAETENAGRMIGLVNDMIGELPAEILRLLQDEGYKIKIMESDLRTLPYSDILSENALAVTYSGDGWADIFIENSPEAIRSSAVHELGHAFDHCMGFPSKYPAFARIMEKESERFVDLISASSQLGLAESYDLLSSTPKEYFAELFRWYFAEGGLLLKTCPESFGYIENLVYPE